jgi:phage protein D
MAYGPGERSRKEGSDTVLRGLNKRQKEAEPLAGISYRLLIDGKPLSQELTAAVQQVEVEDHARMADMLRLQMSVAIHENGEKWTILDEDIFRRLTNISVEVFLDKGRTVTLISSYVIDARVEFSNNPGSSVLKVVAMDPTVLMNLDEQVRAWPDMADSDIASTLFSEYGFEPEVEATSISRQEIQTRTIQRGTDIQFLQKLAKRNGYECYVETSLSGGSARATGHFHRPKVDEQPQGVLTVNMGEATNINSFKARYDMLKPVVAQATGLEIESQSDQPARAEGASLKDLGKSPAAMSDRPRRILLSGTGLAGAGELQTYAQAVVDESSWAITAEGELNTVAYGGILRAKSPVLVRGAGKQFSGLYYVEKVLHVFASEGQGYIQRFSLRRNALGVTRRENFAEDAALRL